MIIYMNIEILDEKIEKFKKLNKDIKDGIISMRQYSEENHNSINDIIYYIKLKYDDMFFDMARKLGTDSVTLSGYANGHLKLDEQFIEKLISSYGLDKDEVNFLYELLNNEENKTNG